VHLVHARFHQRQHFLYAVHLDLIQPCQMKTYPSIFQILSSFIKSYQVLNIQNTNFSIQFPPYYKCDYLLECN
jgi:hypothetical protein